MTVTNTLLRLLVLAVIFVNGWTDAPNAIASAVGSGAMTFRRAVSLAALCNFAGAAVSCLLLPTVAATVGELVSFADGQSALNALCAADSILVPVQCEYFALEGLSDLMNTVRIVRRALNPQLELEGVLLTMFDGRTNLAIQVAQEVKHYFPGKVYASVIPRNVRLSEAPSHGKPIYAYDRTSRGAEAYTAFTEEFLRKNR